MLSLGLSLLVLINPIALFLYLKPIMHSLSEEKFIILVVKASLIAGGIYALFMLTGEYIFTTILQVNFESFRLFGGLIIFGTAYIFIVQGRESFIHMKDNLDEMATQLALPFIVGAGSISVCIVIGNSTKWYIGLLMLVLVLLINIASIFFLKLFRESLLLKTMRVYFDKLLGVAFRLNAFFMGAVGTDMLITAIQVLFHM